VAANLSPILPALEKAFSETNPTPVRFVVGSSGKLATQILQGAPFDVFLSADESYPLQLQANGLCAAAPRVYALGVLVLVFRKDLASAAFPAGVDWSRVDRLAIADPALAPYGRAAIEYLQHTIGAKEFSGKRVVGQSIGQAAQFLLSGSVDAGFLSLSQVTVLSNQKWAWTIVPEDEYTAIRQAAVLLKRKGRTTIESAAAFFDFLFSPDAVAIFREAGYRSPELNNDATDSS
jgi:molybdate transport system substrate-binding protein